MKDWLWCYYVHIYIFLVSFLGIPFADDGELRKQASQELLEINWQLNELYHAPMTLGSG